MTKPLEDMTEQELELESYRLENLQTEIRHEKKQVQIALSVKIRERIAAAKSGKGVSVSLPTLKVGVKQNG